MYKVIVTDIIDLDGNRGVIIVKEFDTLAKAVAYADKVQNLSTIANIEKSA